MLHSSRCALWLLFFPLLAWGAVESTRQEVTPPAAGSGGGRPNIVLLVLDDLDAAMGGLAAMPATQRLLVAQGTSFDQFFISTPLCCPSRATLLLGQFAHNHGVLTAAPPLGGFARVLELDLEGGALPVALQEAGYRTALIGRYFNGYPEDAGDGYVPPGWDEWLSPLWGAGFSYFDYDLNDDGLIVHQGHAAADYSTDVLAARALRFVREAGAGDRPFFLFLAPLAPHRPTAPAPRHRRSFRGARIPRAPSFDETDVADKPAYIRALPRLSAAEIAGYDAVHQGRLQTLAAADDMVRRLLATLEEVGLAAHTFVFLTSDNGFHLGQHRLRPGKGSPYEEDVRVPLVVAGPGVPHGRRLPHLALGVDLAPTIVALAGGRLRRPVDGRSLVPLLQHDVRPAAAFRRAALLEAPAGGEPAVEEPPEQAAGRPAAKRASAPPRGFAGLRTARLKYVEYPSGERELYDLALDPYELHNLAATAPQELLARLSRSLRALVTCRGARCREADRAEIPLPD